MKNPPSGDISVMMNAVTAAQSTQDFIYRGWEVRTNGNPYAHCIMRGYIDTLGHSKPNYHYEDLMAVYNEYQKRDLKHPAIIVDTNHANSNKQYLEQIRIAKEVLHSRKLSSEIKGLVKGLMTESYIEDGAQKIGDGIYGKSITDPCLGWDKTEKLLLEIAELV
ncbi:MAG: 3-deoxy-7-phosphoheptulonate synthase, partial [Eubacterium sp.]|nr:3-deoxy-7-phosphoheptulonate synthase [Eubacterium sp.]